MRKLLACFLIFTAMFMCSSRNEKPIFNGVEGVYTFYLNSASSNAEMVTVTTNEAESIKSKLKNISYYIDYMQMNENDLFLFEININNVKCTKSLSKIHIVQYGRKYYT